MHWRYCSLAQSYWYYATACSQKDKLYNHVICVLSLRLIIFLVDWFGYFLKQHSTNYMAQLHNSFRQIKTQTQAMWDYRSWQVITKRIHSVWKFSLTHWGWNKMANIFQTTFSYAFSLIKMYQIRLRFHWSMFLIFKLTIFWHWFRWWLGVNQAKSHYLNQWWLVCWRIYVSLYLNELWHTLLAWQPQWHDSTGLICIMQNHISEWHMMVCSCE